MFLSAVNTNLGSWTLKIGVEHVWLYWARDQINSYKGTAWSESSRSVQKKWPRPNYLSVGFVKQCIIKFSVLSAFISSCIKMLASFYWPKISNCLHFGHSVFWVFWLFHVQKIGFIWVFPSCLRMTVILCLKKTLFILWNNGWVMKACVHLPDASFRKLIKLLKAAL